MTEESIMPSRRIHPLAGLLAGVLFVPALGHADSGTAELIGSFLANYARSEFGDTTYTAGGSSGTLTVSRSSGGPFVQGSSGVIECTVSAKKSPAGLDLEANCLSTFSPEDKLFWVSRRKSGDVAVGSPGEGITQIIGGSGRFAGMTGRCTYKIDPLPGNRLAGISQCQWQR
jgi:hypothetical protein